VSPSLYSYFSKGHGRDILKKLYKPRETKPALAIHPGGPRILEAVGDVFFELGWPEDALEGSYDTFSNFGNLGSAAMLFVLAHRLVGVYTHTIIDTIIHHILTNYTNNAYLYGTHTHTHTHIHLHTP
jgi:hypothetical protein